MLELDFTVEKAEPTLFAAEPQIAFHTRIVQRAVSIRPIHNILLHIQIRIEPYRRHYGQINGHTERGLTELFGARESWARNMRSLLWTHVNYVVPAFEEQTTVQVPVPCSFDFNLAATKYFGALSADSGDSATPGDLPLILLFSGTVFFRSQEGALRTAPIPWDREAIYRLPVTTWKMLTDHYYPNGAWLRLRNDVFAKLRRFKSEGAFPTFEHALESLLNEAEHE